MSEMDRNEMDKLEKAEKLSEKANVSLEEAKEALEKNEWDLLDAMVYLEKNGKAEGPQKSTQSTQYEEQDKYEPVGLHTGQEKEDAGERFVSSFKRMIRTFYRKTVDNSLVMKRNGEDVFDIPVLWAVIILIIFTKWVVLAAAVSLFFGCRYSIKGKDDAGKVNAFFDKAGNVADNIKDEFK